MMNDTVENWALHAFADGELEGEEKRKVEVFLRDNPDARHVLTDIAAQKAALVIGNGAYRSVTPLVNPPNDANDMAASLGRIGYAVTLVKGPGVLVRPL